MTRFPILMYHRIDSPHCPVLDREERRYAVSLEQFARQLRELDAKGMKTFTVSGAVDAMRDNSLGPGSVVLTFDDGNRSDVVHALPMLRDRGFKATFYITVDSIGKPDGLDVQMVRKLVSGGMEIGSHGMTHRFLSLLSGAELETECKTSRDALSGIAGVEIRSFAAPGGRIPRSARRTLATCRYDSICTSRPGFNRARGDGTRLRRFPIMAGISPRIFTAILAGDRRALLPLYMRSQALWLARALLGEQMYHRSREKALWD